MKKYIMLCIFLCLFPVQYLAAQHREPHCKSETGGGLEKLKNGDVQIGIWVHSADCATGDGGFHLKRESKIVKEIEKRFGHIFIGQIITLNEEAADWIAHLEDPNSGRAWPMPGKGSVACHAGPKLAAGGTLTKNANGVIKLSFTVETVDCAIFESGVNYRIGSSMNKIVEHKYKLPADDTPVDIDARELHWILEQIRGNARGFAD